MILPENHVIADGDVFKLHKLKSTDKLQTWCRHNILTAELGADGVMRFLDTYWGNSDRTCYFLESIESMTLMGNLNEFETATRQKYDGYADEDRMCFPMGGYPERCFVRKGVGPNRGRLIENARYEVESRESDLRFAEYRLDSAKQRLAELEAGS